MKKKRVLFILDSLNLGGTETFAVNILKAINKELIQIDFLISTEGNCYYDKDVQDNGSMIVRTKSKSKRPVKYCVDLIRLIKQNGYDVVHIHASNPMAAIPVYCAGRCGVKTIIVHSHTASNGEDKLLFKVGRRYIRSRATHLLSCSDLAGKWMFGEDDRIRIINNGIEAERFRFDEKKRNKVRKDLDIQGTVFIHVGSFSEVKNHDYLVDVFNEILNIDPSCFLLLLGEGKTKDTIERKVNRLGLGKKVLFIGNSRRVSDYLSASDCFVFPSQYEGLPITVIEAQANGIDCCISSTITRQVFLTDLVDSFDIMRPPKEVASMILQKLSTSATDNRGLYADIIKDLFSIEKTAKELETIYCQDD